MSLRERLGKIRLPGFVQYVEGSASPVTIRRDLGGRTYFKLAGDPYEDGTSSRLEVNERLGVVVEVFYEDQIVQRVLKPGEETVVDRDQKKKWRLRGPITEQSLPRPMAGSQTK